MKFNKKLFISLGLIFIVIIIIGLMSQVKAKNEAIQKAYQTGEGLTDSEKKKNVQELIVKKDYDGAKTLADNYYYYDKDLKKHSEYLNDIIISKQGKSISTEDKLNDELDKITTKLNSVGVNKLTKEETISFINKYMVFWDANKDNQSEFHDVVVENLLKLKQRYYSLSKTGVISDSNIKLNNPQIGMTKSEVIAFTKYIKAKDINKTTTKHSINEQHCFSNGHYLYFENDELTTIQE